MKKILPILFFLLLVVFARPVLAADASGSSSLSNIQTAIDTCKASNTADTDCFIPDADVQFAGNVAVRSQDLLNWVIEHYRWSEQSGNFSTTWIFVRNIVYSLLGLCVLAASFLLIITRGKSLTVRKFVPTFIFVVVLVTLSFSLIQFLYQIGDVVQQFFLQKPGANRLINDTDLLHIGFKYGEDFGYRLANPKFDESVFITLLLTKITAISYYAMFAVLMIRKIILWFFLIVSPIFPLLFLFPLVRNSAKIWIGEFFRWLLYGPLFAVFLAGLVALWTAGIPLSFKCNTPDTAATQYPTSTAILLGGPCQSVSISNNLNDPNTFIQYVVALMMIWAVIILPFILLKIFLDYFNNFSLTESNIVKYLARAGAGGVAGAPGRAGVRAGVPNPTPISPFSPPPANTGLARSIPNFEHSPIQEVERNMAETAARTSQVATSGLAAEMEQKVAAQQAATTRINEQVSANQSATTNAVQSEMSQTAMNIEANVAAQQQAADQAAGQINEATTNATSTIEQVNNAAATSQVTQQAVNVMVTAAEAASQPLASLYPRISATFDSVKSTISEPIAQMASEFKQSLSDVFNVTNLSIPSLVDVAKFETEITTKEVSQRTESNKVSEIINRIAGVSPIATPAEKAAYATVREKLVSESQKGNTVAQSIISAAVPAQAKLNEVNQVQQVSVEDYEQIKKLWKDNYTNAAPPAGPDGKPQERKAWLKQEVEKIPEVIDLLLSGDPQKVAQGKQMVSKILPFLLLGGFSKAEIIAYLKAKLAAAKEVMNDVLEVEKDEDSKVEVEREVKEAPKTMQAEALPINANQPIEPEKKPEGA